MLNGRLKYFNKEFSKVKYRVEYLHNPNDTPIEFTDFTFYGNELQKVNQNDEDVDIRPSYLNKIPHRVEHHDVSV